jgi:hypothetical protein
MGSRQERIARLRAEIAEEKEEKEELELQRQLLVARRENARRRAENDVLSRPSNPYGIAIRGLPERARQRPPVIVPPVPAEQKEEEADEEPVVAEPLALSNKHEQAMAVPGVKMSTWKANRYPLTADTAQEMAQAVLRVATGIKNAQVRFNFVSSRSEESLTATKSSLLRLDDMTKVLQSLSERHVDGESGGALLLTSVSVIGIEEN